MKTLSAKTDFIRFFKQDESGVFFLLAYLDSFRLATDESGLVLHNFTFLCSVPDFAAIHLNFSNN